MDGIGSIRDALCFLLQHPVQQILPSLSFLKNPYVTSSHVDLEEIQGMDELDHLQLVLEFVQDKKHTLTHCCSHPGGPSFAFTHKHTKNH